MSFIITNFEFTGSVKYHNIYYSGDHIKIELGHLRIAKSSNIILRGKFAEDLGSMNINYEVLTDDFYIAADYDCQSNEILIQTDMVGYESGYIYRDSISFAFSDDIHLLLKVLTENKLDVSISINKVKEFICFGRNFFEDTVFDNIIRLNAARIYKYSFNTNNLTYKEYDSFTIKNKVNNVNDAAQNLYSTIDNYFLKNKIDNYIYGLGVSGGLDSRVAGYFALKHDYTVHPFFIGLKNNSLGMLRYDAKRSIEVANELNLNQVEFINPLCIDLQSKLINDVEYAPIATPNVAQNIGNNFKFNVLIHGMMGGELFGAIIPKNIDIMTNSELAEYILKSYTLLPKYKGKGTLIAKLFERLPLIHKFVLCSEEALSEAISEEEYENCKERLLNWITTEKKKGLSNVNIILKDFYYRFSPGVKIGYYSTIGDNYPALGVYMNPSVLRTALEWSDDLFKNRIVQYRLIQMCGNLSHIRSQSYSTNANKNVAFNEIMKIYSIIERIVRGGSMVYNDWFTIKEIYECEKQLTKGSKVYEYINFNTACRESGMQVIFFLIKMAIIENKYKLSVR